MSVIQKIRGCIEVSYSKERNDEMKAVYEKNCPLVHFLLKHGLETNGATDVKLSVPHNRDRTTDVILTFTVPTIQDLERMVNIVKQCGEDSIDHNRIRARIIRQ